MFYLSRGEQIVLFVLLALLLAGGAVLTYARGLDATRVGSDQPIFIEAPAVSSSGGEIVVVVEGAVSRPGPYRLPKGSRVADALDRAGGPLPDADLSHLALTAALQDQERLTVPTKDAGPGASAVRPAPSRISLNNATIQELQSLPGIGPIYAQRILEYRERSRRERGHGFESVDELLNVPGIGPKRLAALRDYVIP